MITAAWKKLVKSQRSTYLNITVITITTCHNLTFLVKLQAKRTLSSYFKTTLVPNEIEIKVDKTSYNLPRQYDGFFFVLKAQTEATKQKTTSENISENISPQACLPVVIVDTSGHFAINLHIIFLCFTLIYRHVLQWDEREAWLIFYGLWRCKHSDSFV